MVNILAASLGIAAVVAVPVLCLAQTVDPKNELTTASQHAGLASRADALRTIRMHLQHVVNCLGGPNADGYDAAPGNPCRDQGNGAIPDTTDQAQKQRLTEVLDRARAGVTEGDIGAAKRIADDVERMLPPT